MRIVAVETRLVDLPLPRPIGTAIHAIRSVGCVLVTLRTDDGIAGESFVFTINGARLEAFHEMIRGLGELIVGRDPHDTGAIWSDLWKEVNPTGHAGVTIAAMSSLDVACWDIVGRAADLPLSKVFGACRDSVDTYASSGLWLDASLSGHRRGGDLFRRAGLHCRQAEDRQRHRRSPTSSASGPSGRRSATTSDC